MPTPDQILNIPITTGLDEQTDEYALDPPALTIAENIRFARTNSTQKRNGIAQVASTTACTPWRMMDHRNQLAVINTTVAPSTLSIYSPTQDKYISGGTSMRNRIKHTTVVDSVDNSYDCDAVSVAGYRFVVWQQLESGGYSIRWCCIDEADGSFVVEPVTLTSLGGGVPIACPHVDACGTTSVILSYWNGTDIVAHLLVQSSIVSGFTGAINVSSFSPSSTYKYDMCCTAGFVYFAWYDSATPRTYLKTMSNALVAATNTFIAGPAASDSLSISVDLSNATLWLLHSGAAINLSVWTYTGTISTNFATATATGPTAIVAARYDQGLGVAAASSTSAFVCASRYSTWFTKSICKVDNLAAVTGLYTSRHTTQLTKPGIDSAGNAYVISLYPSVTTVSAIGSMYLEYLNTTSGPTGILAGYIDLQCQPQLGDAPRTPQSMARFTRNTAGQLVAATPVWTDLSSIVRLGVAIAEVWPIASLDLENSQAAQDGVTTLLSGGLPAYYDGGGINEASFAYDPYFTAAAAIVGGAVVAGDYYYAAIWSKRLMNGQVVRSAPYFTPKVTVGGGGTDGVTITAQTLGMTFGSTPVLLEIYRTVVGQSGPFYKLTQEPVYSYVLNDATQSTIGFNDTHADANIGGSVALNTRPQLYTTLGDGEPFADEAPPYGNTVITHDNRWWIAHRNQLWFTSAVLDGLVPGFSADNVITIDAIDGEIVALASMDGRLVVFGPESIFGISGNGPAPNGEGAGYSYPQEIHASIGCRTNRSVVATPDGVVFAGNGDHIYMLTRSNDVVDIGLPVRRTIENYMPAFWRSASWVVDQQEVRLALSATIGAGAGTSGRVLVYNMRMKAWTTASYATAVGGSTAPQTAAYVNGTWYWGSSAQTVKETTATSLDYASTWCTQTVETAWIKMNGPGGYANVKKVLVAMRRLTNHDLTIQIGYNYATAYSDTFSFGGANLTTDEQLLEIYPHTPLCAAMRLKISDGNPVSGSSGTGAGFRLFGVQLLVSSPDPKGGDLVQFLPQSDLKRSAG